MDVKKFLDEVHFHDEIPRKIAELTNSGAISDLQDFLLIRDDHTFDKRAVPRLICRGLLQFGKDGVKAMIDTLPDSPGSIYPIAIIEALWFAARGKLPPTTKLPHMLPLPTPLCNPPSLETIEASRQAFEDLVVESQLNEDLFDQLITFLWQANMEAGFQSFQETAEFRSTVFSIFAESSIKISRRLIEELRSLVEKELREEEYQRFFAKHPVFLDSLANTVIPKQSLGSELITDYVIKRLDNEYLVVEIEKPQDGLFTQNNNFTANFIHAFGQVIDFQEWVDAHGEYARSRMPGISSPRGLLIMGRKTNLSSAQLSKLKRYVINSQSIEVLTYDDVIERAENLYNNIHKNSKNSDNNNACQPSAAAEYDR